MFKPDDFLVEENETNIIIDKYNTIIAGTLPKLICYLTMASSDHYDGKQYSFLFFFHFFLELF